MRQGNGALELGETDSVSDNLEALSPVTLLSIAEVFLRPGMTSIADGRDASPISLGRARCAAQILCLGAPLTAVANGAMMTVVLWYSLSVRLDRKEKPTPYFHIPSVGLGPFSVHAFGVIAALAVVLGVKATRHRAAELGLDVHVVDRLMPWLVLAVFVGAHLVSVVLYYPDEIIEDPLVLLRLWDGLSSFGGILGGLVAVYLFFRRLGIRKKHYVQALLFGTVVSLLVGRFGCAVTHDHPGKVTTCPLAVQGWPTAQTPERTLGFYTDGPRRHDLGLYEFLFLIPVTGILYALRRCRPFEHFHIVLVLLLYTPVRFCLDFLRVAEKQYLGLTPGQYFAVAFLVVGLGLAVWSRRHDVQRPPPAPA